MATHPFPDLTAPKWSPRLLALVVTLSLVVIVTSQSPQLWDRYRVEKDVQYYYWMARYQDPDLFPKDDLLSERIVEVDVLGRSLILYPRSLGYGLLFYLASFVIDHIWLSKWLVFFLMPFSVVYLFKLGKLLGGNFSALSLSLLSVFFFLASPRSTSIFLGVQRAFAIPLLIAFAYHVTAKQHLRAGLVVLASALFYLPDFPLTAIPYVLSLAKIGRPFRLSLDVSRSRLALVAGTLLLSTLVVVFAVAVEFEWFAPQPADVPPSDADEAESLSDDPYYQSQGAKPVFDVFPWFGRAGIFDVGADVLNFSLLLVFGFLIYAVLGPRSLQRLPSVFWSLLAAGVLMFFVSLFAVLRFSSFALYFPSRYTRSVLLLLVLCFVGLNWIECINEVAGWLRRNVRLAVFFVASLGLSLTVACLVFRGRFPLAVAMAVGAFALKGVAAVLCGGVVLWALQPRVLEALGKGAWWWQVMRVIILLAFGVAAISWGADYAGTLEADTIDPPRAARDVYEFVASLPEEAVIAGDPVLMDGVLLFSKRSVIFTDLMPLKGTPILDYFDAVYAESPEGVLDFCRRFGVSYLVIDDTIFDPGYLADGDFFYQPYNDEIARLVAGRSDFVLPDAESVFTSGSLSVIECDAGTLLAGE